jgi:magnesium chelatase accessory protein
VGENDRTVPPSEAERVRAILPRAKLRRLPGLGHLAHEERPGKVAEMLCRAGALAKP